MKGRLPPKPSKASLVSRGLSAKDKGKTGTKAKIKSKKANSTQKPGYALYSTDSEAEQVTDVHKGLDRCAALLSHILDGEETQGHRPGEAKKGQDKQKRPKNSVNKGKPKEPVPQQKGPPFNERLPTSTPVMTPEQRQRQQSLAQRQEILEQQLASLSKQYNFVKEQPWHATQDQEPGGSLHQPHPIHSDPTTPQHDRPTPYSNTLQPPHPQELTHETPANHPQEMNHVYNSMLQPPPQTDSLPVSELQAYLQTQLPNNYTQDHSIDYDVHIPERDPGPVSEIPQLMPILSTVTTQSNVSKQVAFSDDVTQHSFTPSPTSRSAVTQTALVENYLQDLTPPSSPSSPKAVHSHVKTLHYLIGELRSLLGDSGDLELYRLLNEIDKTASLLQYVQTGSMNIETNSIEMDLALQPLRTENAHLRRRLRITNQKLKDCEMKLHQSSMLSKEPSFELAACQSLNEILKQQVEQERNMRGKMARELTQLKKEVIELRNSKQEMLELLAKKTKEAAEPRQAKSPNACSPHEVSAMRRQVNSLQLALEAAGRENQIALITLKQKDQELDRLKAFTRGLQMFMKKIVSDLDDLPVGNEILGLLSSDAILLDVEQFMQAPQPPDRNLSRSFQHSSQSAPRERQQDGLQNVSSQPLERHPREFEHRPFTSNTMDFKNHARFTESSVDHQHDQQKREFEHRPATNTRETSMDYRNHEAFKESSSNHLHDQQTRKFEHRPVTNNGDMMDFKNHARFEELSADEYEEEVPRRDRRGHGAKLTNNNKQDLFYSSPPKTQLHERSTHRQSTSKHHSYHQQHRIPTHVSPRTADPNSSGSDVSSLTSQDEEEFTKELANLDADIERLQAMLKETSSR